MAWSSPSLSPHAFRPRPRRARRALLLHSLLSVNDAIDTRTAAGRLVLHVLAAVSQWEREATAERTRDALGQLRARGLRLGGEALGWRRSQTRDGGGHRALERIVDEAATIDRIVELDVNGHSLREIADILQLEGRATKRGGRWHPMTIQRVLERHQPGASPS